MVSQMLLRIQLLQGRHTSSWSLPIKPCVLGITFCGFGSDFDMVVDLELIEFALL